MSDIPLSKDFYLSNLLASEEATRLSLNNAPSDDNTVNNLRELARNILQPVADNFSAKVIINSGYRSPVLNAHVGGVPTSQHQKGEAADFVVIEHDCLDVARWIAAKLAFDQLILEYYDPEKGQPGYLHCSYVSYKPNRHHLLTYDGFKYHNGILSPAELSIISSNSV